MRNGSRVKEHYRIGSVAVLGSGVMGSQIAAHCVNAGLDVLLLDLKSDDPTRPDKIAEESVKKLKTMRPSPLALPEYADRISAGNFEDDMGWLWEVDWVCEAVIEKMDVKRGLMKQIEEATGPHTVVTSNTSGLPISEIAEGCSDEFRSRLLGAHFFNPPRYMHLLELIPTGQTDPDVTKAMHRFCEVILGKGVVRCNDTPNFIANRVGIFSMASIFPWFFSGRLRAEEIDLLTGTLTGYSRPATFRTSDIVGIDVLAHVADNLWPAIPDDERREVFRLPEGVKDMVNDGLIGNKANGGFYKKVWTDKGKEFHVLNPETMDYEPQKTPRFDVVDQAKKQGGTAGERLKFLLDDDGQVGSFLREITWDLLLYAANRIPEITPSISSLDRAMCRGFNWELGPFERWDAIGVEASVEKMKADGRSVPESVLKMLEAGRNRFYEGGSVWNLVKGEAEPVEPPAAGAITAAILKRESSEVWSNDHAALLDMGDGVAQFEFRTRQNTLGFGLIDAMQEAFGRTRDSFEALVIGHDGENFSYGANLAEVLKAAKEGNFNLIDNGVKEFQQTAVDLRRQPYPVVAAVAGRTLGGAVEFMMHADHVVAHHELYAGLVELGVGLIPGGGGTKELLRRSLAMVNREEEADPLPWIRSAFKTIGLAKVSESAPMARKMLFLRESDTIVMNRDLLLKSAKNRALLMSDSGYVPPPDPMIRLSGRTAFSALKLSLLMMKEAGQITGWDEVLATHVARILTGGALSEPQDVPETYVLKLEREALGELVREKKSLARMEQMLKTGNPLRN